MVTEAPAKGELMAFVGEIISHFYFSFLSCDTSFIHHSTSCNLITRVEHLSMTPGYNAREDQFF